MTVRPQKINGKQYIVPHYNLEGYEKYLLPKLDFKGMQHVYFNPDDINEVYKEQNMDPDNLDCNLKYDPEKDMNKLTQAVKEMKKKQEVKLEEKQEKHEEEKGKSKEEVVEEVKGKIRPALREKGFTHFIQIPLTEACRESYENVIKTVIDDNDRDALAPLNSLHATIMVFRLHAEADLPKWKRILQSIKLRKVKLTLKGTGIFPVKPNTNFTKVFYVKVSGLDDLFHDVVQKAITEGLVTQKELSFIHFDKKTDMYRTEQTHLTILKTKGDDIIDATTYLKQLAKLWIPKVNFSDIRLSMLGTFDGDEYFDEFVIPVDK